MILKILKKDFLRKKGIAVALFIFIMLSATLVASGTYVTMVMINSIEDLFEASSIPHYVQMHSGELNQTDIDSFVSENDIVDKQQTVKMINIDGMNLFMGDSQEAQMNSVMQNAFVKQNKSFDFLLNLENDVIQVSKGEIAVPIYYMQQNDIKIGDIISVNNGSFKMQFTITDFVRDAQMNPSIISSKRFVINESDYDYLEMNLGEIEYLIEFQLDDMSMISEFGNSYQSSGLPAKGPTVDYDSFKILNALTDGIVVIVIIFVSVLLVFISILCLRFTFLATIEEDYKEIGVMKAIGIRHRDIKFIYLIKYIVLGATASLAGYVASLYVGQLFTSNILLYLGTTSMKMSYYMIPFITVIILFLVLILFCFIILRRFNRISAVEALRSGNMGENGKRCNFFKLSKLKFISVNLFVGLKDIFCRFKMYSLLLFIFIISAFIMIVPSNLLNTIKSREFITYLGIGESDIRIDLQQSEDIAKRYNEVINYIKNDKDVMEYSPTVTCKYKVLGSDETWDNINVETGNFTVFPLEYLKGSAPVDDKSIALSYLCASELEKELGDTISILVNEEQIEMTVCGIYQDVTNGGKSAKAMLPVDVNTVLWYVVSLNVNPDINIDEKVANYNQVFESAQITDIDNYLLQTLGVTIKQLKLVSVLALIIALFVAALITALFLKMLIAKDNSQVAVMKSIGFTIEDIKVQYITRVVSILLFGILIGTIAANTLGPKIVSTVSSSMGASQIKFVINSFEAYVFYPLLLLAVVMVTTLLSIVPMKKSSITEMIIE